MLKNFNSKDVYLKKANSKKIINGEALSKKGIYNTDNTWIMLVLLIILVIASFSVYFYFSYYRFSNFSFSDTKFNFIENNSKGFVKPGDEITYTINYRNIGNKKVSNFIIETKIPQNTIFVKAEGIENDTYIINENKITFKIGNLLKNDGGKRTFTVKVLEPLDNGTKIFSPDALFKYTVGDRNFSFFLKDNLVSIVKSSPCISELEVKVFEVFSGKVLQDKGDEVNIGDTLGFLISLKNNGDMDADDVEIINFLPDELYVVQSDVKDNGIYLPDDEKIVWKVNKLKAKSSTCVYFKAVVRNEVKNLKNFRDIIKVFYNGKLIDEKVIEKKINSICVLNKSEIKVEDINGGDVWALDKLRYTIFVKNTGNGQGRNIEVYCPIPAGMGYINNSADNEASISEQNGTIVKWFIDKIESGEVKKYSFDVFIADYVTYGAEINTNFYIKDGFKKIELKNPTINVAPSVFELIACMGDSLTALTGYPELLEELLEKEFPHAEFKVLSSGIKGEMANQAIRRFDRDIRVYNPDIIILGYGANDAGEGTGYFRYYMDVLVKQALSTGAKVFVFGIGYIDTSIYKWAGKENYTIFNEILEKDICLKDGAVYIDLYKEMSKNPQKYLKSDGIHWNEEGTRLVVKTIINALKIYMDKDGRIIK